LCKSFSDIKEEIRQRSKNSQLVQNFINSIQINTKILAHQK